VRSGLAILDSADRRAGDARLQGERFLRQLHSASRLPQGCAERGRVGDLDLGNAGLNLEKIVSNIVHLALSVTNGNDRYQKVGGKERDFEVVP